MTTFSSTIDLDGNGRPIYSGYGPFLAHKRVTFDGGTENGIGDLDGTQNPYTIFTVTGTIVATGFAVVRTAPEGEGATFQGGVSAMSDLFHSTAVANAAEGDVLLGTDHTVIATIGDNIVMSECDVILTTVDANITAGVIDYYLLWRPISENGQVE